MTTELESVLKSAEATLEHANPVPFSAEGFQRLQTKISEYIAQLIAESVRVSRAHEADSISPSYVDRASHYLVIGRGSRLYKFIGIIGGVLFGVGASSVATMLATNQFSARGIIIAFGCVVIGGLSISLQLMKD